MTTMTAIRERPKLAPFRLAPWFSERVWGRRDLRPWYAATGTAETVGEAWLTGPKCLAETGPLAGRTLEQIVSAYAEELLGTGADTQFPLLIKLLFPADKLSVQVHPDDAHAQRMGQPRGKTECWYVLEAEPGAVVGLGLKAGVTPEQVRVGIADASLEDLMNWIPVERGDMVFVDAGTVHAIGPGMVLLETQQTSDTTYRLYDYGRPRELHVDHGLQVMKSTTLAGKILPYREDGFVRLIEQRYFTVDRYDLSPDIPVQLTPARPGCVVVIDGTAEVRSAGGAPLELLPGYAAVLPVSAGPVQLCSERGATVVRCFAPSLPEETTPAPPRESLGTAV